jgi:inward rectifier potassium channel
MRLRPRPHAPAGPPLNVPVDTTDLGFGARVSEQSSTRFLNRDGSFGVRRGGLPWLQSRNLYHVLLTISWPRFHALVVAAYFTANALFACGYLACGPQAIEGSTAVTFSERFFDAFFFSVQTMGTLGYGRLSPIGLGANLLVTIESLAGLLGLALATGLLFARFSRPYAKILFSERAVVAPYHGITAFEFRIANQRSSELIDVHATVVLTRMETSHGRHSRRYHSLKLEREQVMFFPLHWVIVHPITEDSPLADATPESLAESDAEFLVLLSATDETFSQVVHARSSYKAHEIVWRARFADMFQVPGNGTLAADLRRLHEIERKDLP